MSIDKGIFSSFCHCRYKAFLKTSEVVGEPAEYELVRREADERFRVEAIERLLRQTEGGIARFPTSLPLAIEGGNALVLGAKVEGLGMALTYEVIEMHVDRHEDRQRLPVPVLFSHKDKLDREDSLLAALHGIVLAEAIDLPVPFVKVVHGSGFSVSKIKLDSPSGRTRLATDTRQILDRLRRQIESSTAPPIILNAHCPACEFCQRCRAEAIGKDDLSLLRGMSEKEILAQRQHGITTVAQFAGTFRPKSVGMKTNKPLKRHLHALQALAVRDKKVYVVRTPEFRPRPPVSISTWKGYQIGISITSLGLSSRRMESALPTRSGPTTMPGSGRSGSNSLLSCGAWATAHSSIMAAMRRPISRRCCGSILPSTPRVAGGWTTTSINVLGAIRTNVYFPVHSNGLKDMASFLGATWGGRSHRASSASHGGCGGKGRGIRSSRTRSSTTTRRIASGPACRPIPRIARLSRGNGESPEFNWHPRSLSPFPREIRQDRVRSPGNGIRSTSALDSTTNETKFSFVPIPL